ncbi:HypC/HybG/HupF family hydrogenase formation chaperone [Spongiibacter sp.]|uniref:HypC/HybG/HupF family hydrogenase formation chaperone n=1 Tax=Spongiibacter sp. TaxID=2024860 RepID=UPI003563FF60
MCLGIPGQVVAISDVDNKLGIVDISGVQKEVNLACVVDGSHSLDDCIGSWVLIHVGFAMARIDENEAQATLQLLRELAGARE